MSRVPQWQGGRSQAPPARWPGCTQHERRGPEPAASANPLLIHQRALGNQAVQRLLQAKLAINQPGDAYEQEADQVAEQVMRVPAPGFTGPRLQRKCAKYEEEEEKSMQAKEAPGRAPEVTPAIERQVENIRGGGRPLPEPVRGFFEDRFGHDLREVRLHTGDHADRSARAVGALAFTMGHDVVFAAGEYAPETPAGTRLLAHELTHFIQQGGGERIMRRDAPEVEEGFVEGPPGRSAKIPKSVAARLRRQEQPAVQRAPAGRPTLFRQACPGTCPPAEAPPFAPVSDSSFNCYAYAVNSPPSGFLQPGEIANTQEYRAAVLSDSAAIAAIGGPAAVDSYFTPAGMLRNMTADLGSPISTNCNNCCARPNRKVIAVTTDAAAAVGPDAWDFHWYRKDADRAWSHKRGSLDAQRDDAAGSSPICNPCNASRSYPGLDYNNVVGSWCV